VSSLRLSWFGMGTFGDFMCGLRQKISDYFRCSRYVRS